jgi:hypothetical protein
MGENFKIENTTKCLRVTVHEADHSPPSSAELKITWRYASIPHTSSWLGVFN